MDTASATEAAVIPSQPEPVVVPEPKPLELEEFVHKQYEQAAAPESDTDVKPTATEAQPAAEAKATPEPPAQVEEPFTTEQLGDPKHWDRLDKAGWERAAKLHPVETARVKAGYAAASRIVEQARTAQPRPAEPEQQKEPERDLYAEALAQTDSLDPEERAKGFRALARMEAETLFKPYKETLQQSALKAQASQIEKAAYVAAVESMPEGMRADFVTLDSKELDAAVEGDPELLDDIELAVNLEPEARVRLLAKVMRRAGKIVIENRKSAKAAAEADVAKKANDEKTAKSQERLRSNKTNASSTVVDSPVGKTPSAEKSIDEFVRGQFAALPK